MVDMTITREGRMELILDYDQRIERMEAELAQAVRDRLPAQNLKVRRDFIHTLRGHLENVLHCAKAEGITEREYSEWKQARLKMAGR